MRDRLLQKIAQLSVRRPWWVLGVALIITVISAIIMQNLELSMRWSDLMPEKDPRAVEFNRVLEKYKSASSVLIMFRGNEDQIKAYAEKCAPEIADIKAVVDTDEEALVRRVTLKEDISFLRDHGMMLSKKKDLENLEDMYRDIDLAPLLTGINNNLEKTYIYGKDERISKREKKDNAIRYLDGLKTLLGVMEEYVDSSAVRSSQAIFATDRLLIGDPYFLSYDQHTLMMLAQPTFPVTDTERSIVLCAKIDDILAKHAGEFQGVETGLTGALAMGRDEMRVMQSDMNYLTLIALILILLLFMVSFRMIIAPFLAILVLLVGVIWTAAFTTLTTGSLNIMTSMFAVILIGLGIDFSIHIISAFAENRGEGISISESTENTLLHSGPGITTGGLTTGIAFLTLTISESRGMSQFGLVGGIGVILCMIAAITVLPALLVLRERRKERKGKASSYKPVTFKIMAEVGNGLARWRWVTLGVMVLLTGWFVYKATQLRFDYDMLNIEPDDMESVVWYDSLLASFDMSPDYALVTSGSLDSIRTYVNRAKDFSNIAWVDAVTEYVPSQADQAQRADVIKRIRDSLEKNKTPTKIDNNGLEVILKQLDRLWMNVAEMSDMAYQAGQDRLEAKTYSLVANPADDSSPDYIKELMAKFKSEPQKTIAGLNRFQNDYFDYFRKTAIGMANPEIISVDSLPHDILDRYLSDDGSTYLVSMYPEDDVWNMDNLKAFSRQLQSISPKSTGTPSLFLAMIEIIGADGRRATVLALITILVLLFLDFRKIGFSLLAMVPLVSGAFWMAGIMSLSGMMLNVVNIMAIPMILGIGIDDGVHLIHRYRIEGRNKARLIFTSTGKAILLTSLTTMIGFGSLGFMKHKGMASMGILLFIGVGVCFITSIGWLAPFFGAQKDK